LEDLALPVWAELGVEEAVLQAEEESCAEGLHAEELLHAAEGGVGVEGEDVAGAGVAL
jgi:hypothetical protein